MTGAEQVLIEDWCQQFPSHSVGDARVRRRRRAVRERRRRRELQLRRLRAGRATPVANPCGDPPGGVGATLTPPTRGGRRAAQPGPAHQPATRPALDGTSPRRPGDRRGAARQPAGVGSADANARRIVAYGLRNPFRFTFRPGTNELWVGDVGWNNWEEIDRVDQPATPRVENFGWPCYEGAGRQAGYDAPTSTSARASTPAGGVDARRTTPTTTHARSCPARPARPAARRSPGSLLPGAASYPPAYDGALFFADYSRDCIWAMQRNGADGCPTRRRPRPSRPERANPVDLQIGPGGDLFYADFDGGTIRRIQLHRGQPGAARRRPPRAHHRRPRRSTVALRRHGARATPTPATRSPTPGTSTATAHYDDSTVGASRRCTYTQPGTLHASACGSPTTHGASADRHGRRSPRATRRRRRPSPRRRAGSPGRSATRSPSAARRPTPRTATLPRVALSWSLVAAPLPVRTATPTRAGLRGRRRRLVRRARPRVPVPPRAAAHRRPTPAA